MKIILIAAVSLNGKITKHTDPNVYSWTSLEDQKLFASFIRKNNLIVMGRKTYEAVKKTIKLRKDKLRIVLTTNPKKYAHEATGKGLEFSSESVEELVARLKKKGYSKMLVVGGGNINSLFLKSGLVDEVWLTYEPYIFGQGKTLVNEKNLTISLRLKSIEKLNDYGTLFARYAVEKA